MSKNSEPSTTRIGSNPARWQRLKNILADALEHTSSEERTAVLRQSCADDTALLLEAEKLLAYDTTVFEEFAQFAATRLRHNGRGRIGERIGAYAIVAELGRGGMGAVYLAERADGQFEKRVAIKVLKRGTDTDEVLRRFRIERQILAKLDHPNITRLLDAGTTNDGLPYFVMEFVEGTPITHFVQRENLDLRSRLQLFLKVCSAVGLAHENQIIHRDIKPSNVLVGRDREPKLLDFGIAKLLSVDPDDEDVTVAAERRLTPMYAAPEQSAGQSATIASDVYSLGALLYELLTSQPPRGISDANLSQQVVSRPLTKPLLPSQVVTDPKTKQELQGQLDRIVATAMRPNPAQRYSSVTGLSEDIERYLDGADPRFKCFSDGRSAAAIGRCNSDARSTSRHRSYIAAVTLGAIVLATALLFSLRGKVSWLNTARTKPPSGNSTSAVTSHSIAVLPFDNLSEEKENAYFADGIQGDILTNLSKISDLKVISRRSVMSYRGKTSNVRDIGKALGVSTVLEGNVRRVGNRVRVNVELINAENEQAVWAENYDRDLTDVLAIQTDLAKKIVSELQAKLSPAEKARIERKPTENSEAYLAFVQARNLQSAYEDLGRLRQSEQFFERAIEVDPRYALALSRYSQLQSWVVHQFEGTLARREKARALAERALQLEPDLPEAHLALGFWYYHGDNNYDAALKEFQIAQRGLPNEAEIYLGIGAIQRRQGKWAESTANFEKAVDLDPKDTWPLQNLAFNYQLRRNFGPATKIIDRALKVDPTGLGLWEVKARLAVDEKGDLRVAEDALAVMNSLPASSDEQKIEIAIARKKVLLLLRKYREVLQGMENIPDHLFGSTPGALGDKYYGMGIARKGLHDGAAAQVAFLRAKTITEAQLKQTPTDARIHAQSAKVHAYLGEKEAALLKAQRARELLPETKDAFGGPEITAAMAQVHAILGNNADAVEILEGLLSRPSWITVEGLKADPVWDPLRNDPRFQALLNKYGGKELKVRSSDG
ncbi:MAG TPA: protein kinase [Candidatus Udaeobacter sp.]|nr:protein kinase [Candidatus Udaeobacter sp.]